MYFGGRKTRRQSRFARLASTTSPISRVRQRARAGRGDVRCPGSILRRAIHRGFENVGFRIQPSETAGAVSSVGGTGKQEPGYQYGRDT